MVQEAEVAVVADAELVDTVEGDGHVADADTACSEAAAYAVVLVVGTVAAMDHPASASWVPTSRPTSSAWTSA